MGDKSSIPAWMQAEVAEYDLDFNTPPRTVLDIGANVGAFTLRCLERWPHTRITAAEPVAATAEQFRQNLQGHPNVVLWQVAVRSFEGHDTILLGDQPATSSFYQLGRQTERTENVRCIDAAKLHSFDVVKIDTEGSEVEIVRRLNLSATRALLVEYHRNDDCLKIVECAEAAGLRLHKKKPLGDTWGLLIFARPGVLAEPSASPRLRGEKKLFIALPVYHGLDVFFTQSLIKLLDNPPLPIALRMNPGDSLVSRSRNSLTADFLESDCTHLLFIDTDLIFGADQIARIMEHPEEIVGGFYPKKQEGDVRWVWNGCLEEKPVLPSGLQEVRYMGTGFLRIARSVFERMIEAHPELAYKPDHADRTEYDFWSVGVYRPGSTSSRKKQLGRYLSEDWFFCQRALDIGYKVWGDTRIVLKHVGQAIYPLRSQQQSLFASNGEPAQTADVNRPASAAEPQSSREALATTA